MKSDQDNILHFILWRIYLSDYSPPLIHLKINLWSLLFMDMEKSMSEGESSLIQIFLFNLRLLVTMGTQRYLVGLKERWMAFLCCHVFNPSVLRHFEIKIYGSINCFNWVDFLKDCLMYTLKSVQDCGLEPVICVLCGGSSGNISLLSLILWRVSSFLKED